MCAGKVSALHCPVCSEFIEFHFGVDACAPIKSGALTCCTTLSSPPVKQNKVTAATQCLACLADAPRRAEAAKKAAEAAAKEAKAAEEAIIPKVFGDGDADLTLHSAQYW
ncbi:hypothetical protein OC834_006589 [Tilletia horrida]|uniref:Uncharacterized protein n=1 Tax=Tilletia horrida TaxID=155126 RepID=A0AAN6JL83_9BASI|nr:hypothetical protein OC834_006589 [Tilletia horrida]KAK0532106.1 hypothetical protein OC842_003400 [Tilletia horrida]